MFSLFFFFLRHNASIWKQKLKLKNINWEIIYKFCVQKIESLSFKLCHIKRLIMDSNWISHMRVIFVESISPFATYRQFFACMSPIASSHSKQFFSASAVLNRRILANERVEITNYTFVWCTRASCNYQAYGVVTKKRPTVVYEKKKNGQMRVRENIKKRGEPSTVFRVYFWIFIQQAENFSLNRSLAQAFFTFDGSFAFFFLHSYMYFFLSMPCLYSASCYGTLYTFLCISPTKR